MDADLANISGLTLGILGTHGYACSEGLYAFITKYYLTTGHFLN